MSFPLKDAPAFEYWLTVQREFWHRRFGLIFDYLSELQFANGNFANSIETTAQWINLDALNEAAYRRKMRAHFASGERAQALETYELCRTRLDVELGIQPDAETEALAARIREHQASFTQQAATDTPAIFLENLYALRTREHLALVEYYQQAAGGQRQVVIIRGETGIGKTRLAQNFTEWAVEKGAALLYGNAYESSRRISYQPLISAYRLFLEAHKLPTDGISLVWLQPLTLLLPELTDYFPALGASGVEVDQAHLFEALVRLTLAISNQSPLVLLIDDIQAADHATLDWLRYATQRAYLVPCLPELRCLASIST